MMWATLQLASYLYYQSTVFNMRWDYTLFEENSVDMSYCIFLYLLGCQPSQKHQFSCHPLINTCILSNLCTCHQVRVTNLEDAAEHIGEVLRRVKKEHLQRAYKIQDWYATFKNVVVQYYPGCIFHVGRKTHQALFVYCVIHDE